MSHPTSKNQRPTTGQLRRSYSQSSSINPYELYSTPEVITIGQTVGVSAGRELVELRRQLRDAASTCIRFRGEYARDAAPSERQTWLRSHILGPTSELRQSINDLETLKHGYLQDLQRLLPETESIGATRRFLRDLERRLLKLERLTLAACDELNFSGQQLPKAKYLERIVEEYSQVYLTYKTSSSVGLNKRHPENSPYMQFIRKSAKPLIGHEHGLIEQMKIFRDKLKA